MIWPWINPLRWLGAALDEAGRLADELGIALEELIS